ncbi:hypothetical protein BS47DRAFT_1372766 [Hydnum rufescens UP504]|uniref:FAD-binding PCMH-type domain-containing protein n=1 Tax=Hydnum rufescens UP504 TaxID=1448309 RepID=A0A9P6DVF0_9AGAM|nr:hypothetical protein BS47DRAFT_1372766 [Hydnum rufescens UP504]
MLRVRTTTIVSCLHRPATRLLSTTNVLASQYKSLHNAVTLDDIAHFSSILPKSSILSTLPPINTPPEDLDSYNNDWMTRYKGHSQCVLKPRSTKEVSDILKWCGNTGLVGGGVPVRDEVVINLGNMSNVRSFDPVSGMLRQLVSCQIGGNVATNAGGLRLVRYGSLHGTVLGLEVVLPDGTILSELSTLRKDNTGYDLKQLFIGSEGTLGIITGVSILTPPAPNATSNLLLSLPSFVNVTDVFRLAKSHLSEILSAFEYIDRQSYDLVCRHTGKKALDESEVGNSEAFVLIETSGARKEHDEAKLEALLESLYASSGAQGLITSGTLSQSAEQFATLWSFRELIAEAASKVGKVYKYDVSVPIQKFKEVTDAVRSRVVEVLGYGHFGDGNLHLNIIAEAYAPVIDAALEPFVYELIGEARPVFGRYKGSISAEHGIGVMKAHALHYSKGDVSRAYMRRIKDVFDDRGIMNPGKVIE